MQKLHQPVWFFLFPSPFEALWIQPLNPTLIFSFPVNLESERAIISCQWESSLYGSCLPFAYQHRPPSWKLAGHRLLLFFVDGNHQPQTEACCWSNMSLEMHLKHFKWGNKILVLSLISLRFCLFCGKTNCVNTRLTANKCLTSAHHPFICRDLPLCIQIPRWPVAAQRRTPFASKDHF